MDFEQYQGATVVKIALRRWNVGIVLRLADGTEETLIASADSYYTDSSGIWFGTKEEHEHEDD